MQNAPQTTVASKYEPINQNSGVFLKEFLQLAKIVANAIIKQ